MEHPRTFSVELLDANIEARVQQLADIGPEHRDYAWLLTGLSDFWLYKSEKTEDPHDFSRALTIARQAVSAMLATEPDPAYIIHHLDSVLYTRFMAKGERQNIDECLELSARALKASKFHSAQWIAIRYNWNLRLLEKYKYFGDKKLLDEVVEQSPLLLELREVTECQTSFVKLYGAYASGLCERGKANGSLTELERGIEQGYLAFESCNKSDADYAVAINDLAVRIEYRYQITNEFESLKEAMRLSTLATQTVAKTDSYWPMTLLNHGTFLFALSERVRSSDPTSSLKHLEEAITNVREAIQHSSEEWKRATLITALDNLSAWLGLKLKLTADIPSGEEAVQAAEEALELAPPGYRERPTILNNLVCTLDALYGALKPTDAVTARKHLQRGIEAATSAVNESDERDSRYAERMINLANMHGKLYNDTNDDEVFQRAKTLWLSASSCESARPIVRLSASLKAGQACFGDDDFGGAYKVLKEAVNLLPGISPRYLTSADQQFLLAQGSGIAGLAAAATLQIGKSPYDALKSLEMGRCVISGLAMNAKDDISELQQAHPGLYEQYDILRQSLSQVPVSAHTRFSDTTKDLKKIIEDLTAIEEEIRECKGFENFQLPPSAEELKALASQGPIVVFNVVRYRSDAIIVMTEQITTMRLENLNYVDLETKIGSLKLAGFNSRQRNAIPRRPLQGKHCISAVLQWLWDVAVKPVLEKTTLTDSRRVWWITNGLMALAPLHAAGNHSEGSLENTMSRVVSSYISSFKALSYARKKRTWVQYPRQALLVTMPRTPGHQSLNVEAERSILETSFGNSLTVKEHPTGKEVLAQFSHYSIVHLACHGYLSALSPSESGLLFTKDSESELLPISTIERLTTPHAELAYLSACSTAELTFSKHIDEAINLANCFQVLGFRHVIGTIWSASDHSAGVIAQKFYTRLAGQIAAAGPESAKGDGSELDVARPLHEAVQEYMKDCTGEEAPLHWAPWIHVGA